MFYPPLFSSLVFFLPFPHPPYPVTSKKSVSPSGSYRPLLQGNLEPFPPLLGDGGLFSCLFCCWGWWGGGGGEVGGWGCWWGVGGGLGSGGGCFFGGFGFFGFLVCVGVSPGGFLVCCPGGLGTWCLGSPFFFFFFFLFFFFFFLFSYFVFFSFLFLFFFAVRRTGSP